MTVEKFEEELIIQLKEGVIKNVSFFDSKKAYYELFYNKQKQILYLEPNKEEVSIKEVVEKIEEIIDINGDFF
jgi:hypothetical protein